MEKVSIVIPTKNRSHLLEFALKSALAQTYPDIEIVVCDNNSKDSTRRIVEKYSDKRVLYINTFRDLPMSENWEFALGRATGEYIAYLTDDSYFFPETIEIVLREMKKQKTLVAVWKHCAYFSSDWKESGRTNIVYVPNVTGNSILMNSRENLGRLYGLDESVTILIPKSLNSMCHQSVIEKVQSVQGAFFLPPCPDYTSAAAVLFNTNAYTLIDAPLYLDGVTPFSIGAVSSFNLGKSSQNYNQEFKNGFQEANFLGVPTSVSNIAKGLEKVGAYYPSAAPSINLKALLCGMADRLTKAGLQGARVRQFWTILNEYTVRQPFSVRLRYAVQKCISFMKWSIVKCIRVFPALEYAEQLRSMRILRGERWGFQTIEECASVLQKKRLIRFPYSQELCANYKNYTIFFI